MAQTVTSRARDHLRLVHFGGRPDFFPTGSSVSGMAPLRVGQVRSPRHRLAGHEVSGVVEGVRRQNAVAVYLVSSGRISV